MNEFPVACTVPRFPVIFARLAPSRKMFWSSEHAPLTHAMSDAKFSKSELKVQQIARRRAIEQLLRAPCSGFCKAYEEYPHWQALALWAQSIVDTQGSAPPWLVTDLKRRCPGFLQNGLTSQDAKLVPLQLLRWVHDHEFGYAKQEGWLDALTFYGVRHPRSQFAWSYWEFCQEEWRQVPPSSYPNFEEWLRASEECVGLIEKQRHTTCKEELMATNKAVDTLLKAYVSFVEHEGTFVHVFRKAPSADTRVKLIGELKNLNKKRLEILDQMRILLESQ